MAEQHKNKLQLYFDYFEEHYQPKSWPWYQSLTKYINIIQAIKAELQTVKNFEALTEEEQHTKLNEVFSKCSQNEIPNINAFLERYIFKQDNGIGDVKQGVVWETGGNPHITKIKQNATSNLIYRIITENEIEKTNELIKELLDADRNYDAARNRFIRTLFPDKFASPDASGKLNRLTNAIKKKLNISFEGSQLEQHAELCSYIDTNDPALRQIFTWELYSMLQKDLDLKKAIVYYGAPGTGKTFISDINARQHINLHRILRGESISKEYKIQTVQFHPSYSYEDFFEGIRPTIDGTLRLFNGVFKQFCKDNSKVERALCQDEDFLSDQRFIDVDYDFSQILISQLSKAQKEILGCKAENIAEGLTIQDWIEPAFFIIDEINRAELSKVFGELMYSLEYRGVKGKIKTQYAHLCASENDDSAFFFHDKQNWFFVPQNIYLIGTMNNIDRSVDTFDFALRRRFMWKEIHPNYNPIQSVLSKHGWSDEWCDSLSDSLESLNNSIETDEILNKNYRIGQSYVLELRKIKPDHFDSIVKTKEFLWDNFIQPLLEEYLRGLGDEKKSEEKIEGFKSKFC